MLFVVARERGISSKAVVKEAIEDAEGAVSRLDEVDVDGLRVVEDDTTERASGSRLERVESLVRRRRLSSSLLLLEAAELPVNLLHMMADDCSQDRGGADALLLQSGAGNGSGANEMSLLVGYAGYIAADSRK